MNMWRQLLRRPFHTAAVFVMLAVTGTFFCLSFGILVSADFTREKIEKHFVTVAFPTNEEIILDQELAGGITHERESVITPEMWEELSALPQNVSAVKKIYKQQFINAYCPQISTLITAQEPERYYSFPDEPYGDAVFVITITDIAHYDSYSGSSSVTKKITASVDQTVALHPGYTPREKLIIYCSFQTADEYLAADLRVGKRYLVYGSGYIDEDLLLRKDMAEWNGDKAVKPEEIDLDSISCDLTEYEDYLAERAAYQYGNRPVPLSERIAAVYRFPSGKEYFLKNYELEMIDTGQFSIWVPAGFDEEFTVSITMVDGTKKEFANDILINKLTIAPLGGTLSEFLESEEGAEWSEKIEETKIRHNSVPVIGTDFLESLYQFHQHETSIVEGRAFSDADYRRGNTVCMISEQTARAGGLEVGDTIDLSFFWNELSYINLMNSNATKEQNLTAQEYSRNMGFLREKPTAYTIIGIYRQSGMWDEHAPYGFSPNTVFVPNASLPEVGYSGRAGIFTTFVLGNGGIEEVKAAIEEMGFPESTLLYFDGGYGGIADMVDGFSKDAVFLFAAACGLWLAALAVYLFLAVYSQRKTAGIMLSLGAGKRSVRQFLFLSSMLPAAAAQIFGAVLGMLFLNGTLQSVFANAVDVLSTSYSGVRPEEYASVEQFLTALPQAAFAGGLIQLPFYAVAIYVCVRRMAGERPLKLLRKR